MKRMTSWKNASSGTSWIRNTLSKAGLICWTHTQKLQTGIEMSTRTSTGVDVTMDEEYSEMDSIEGIKCKF